MNIRILLAAEKDIEEGYRFYESRAPDLGIYFIDAIFADIDSLAYYGGIHHTVFGYHRMLTKRFPFAVYYRIIDGSVIIHAILDCRRNPNWIRDRLEPK